MTMLFVLHAKTLYEEVHYSLLKNVPRKKNNQTPVLHTNTVQENYNSFNYL